MLAVTPVAGSNPVRVASSPRLDRGQCPKCLIHYGRAMVAHVRVCTGRPAWPGVGPQPMPSTENGRPVYRDDQLDALTAPAA